MAIASQGATKATGIETANRSTGDSEARRYHR